MKRDKFRKQSLREMTSLDALMFFRSARAAAESNGRKHKRGRSAGEPRWKRHDENHVERRHDDI